MSSRQHLYNEAKLLSVGEHCDPLSAQYLASALHPSHRSHDIVTRPAGPCNKKQTLKSAYLPVVSPFLDGHIPVGGVGAACSKIHTASVRNSSGFMSPNPILGTVAPPANESEKDLPRPFCSTLSQLRSSYCISLKT